MNRINGQIFFISIIVLQISSVLSFAEPTTPVNPNATPEVKALMKLFGKIYGKKIISGQAELSGSSAETERIKKITGKEPVLRDFDFINCTGGKCAEMDLALEWGKRGGIVAFQWHWYAPVGGASYRPKEERWPNGSTFDFREAMKKGTKENIETLKHLDAVAAQIKRLHDANIPIMFRPLHEAEGKWFWWGVRGPDACKQFWKFIYDYFTNHHKLNNIIWVWNQNTKPNFDWYPGDSVLDILTTDLYKEKLVYGSWVSDFNVLSNYIKDKKFIALGENGPIPDPDNCIKDKAKWLWFATWWGDFIKTGYITEEQLKKVYKHDYVITLDEMPELWASVGIGAPGDSRKINYSEVKISAFSNGSDWLIPVFLNEKSDANLRIYDPSGRTIRDIQFSNLPAGRSDLLWNGADRHGDAVLPGIYIYTIESAGMNTTHSAVITLAR